MPFGSIARRGEVVFLAACLSGIAGCGVAPNGDSALSLQRDPIVGGIADPTDDAVMALIRVGGGLVGACTGTTIAKSGGSGYLVTAGHCVVAVDNQANIILPPVAVDPSSLFVLPGPDYANDHTSIFRVADVKFNPRYDGTVESPYDIAIVRYLGATASTVVVPALTPDEDTLAANSMVTLVGFGVTENSQQNTVRRKVDKAISRVTTQQLVFDQSDGKGTCEGDSGGPAIVQTPQGPRVAAVTSSGDATCMMTGISIRTSPSSVFLQDFITAGPKTLSCDECRAASTAPGNACSLKFADCQSGNTACSQFLDCATRCKSQTCVDTCRTSNRAGATASDALSQCECSDVCGTACAGNANCAPAAPPVCGGLGVAGAECNGCIQQHCCTQASACGADATCQGCFGSSSPECTQNALYHTLLTCLASCDANPCRIAPASLDTEAGASTPAPDAGTVAGDDAGASSGPDGGDAVVQASASAGCSCRIGEPLGSKRAPLALLLFVGAAVRLRRRSPRAGQHAPRETAS